MSVRFASDFLYEDEGAVTIDWIAITTTAIVAGIATVYVIYGGGVSALALTLSESVADAPVATVPEVPSFAR